MKRPPGRHPRRGGHRVHRDGGAGRFPARGRRTRREVSSATVRSEMAAFERDGYLVQPHTSAGRIPTDKGYRFFVDHLPGPACSTRSSASRSASSSTTSTARSRRCSSETSGLLADLTDYTAMVVGPSHETATVRSLQLVGLGPRLVLLVVVLADGAVEKRTIELDAEARRGRPSSARRRCSSPTRRVAAADQGPCPSVPTSGDRRSRWWTPASGALGGADGADQLFVGGPPGWPSRSTPSTPCARCSPYSSSSWWW